MSGSGYTYTARSRVPVRPLSYENRALALPKELLMDYKNAKIYICDINGKIIDITTKIINQANEMIKENFKSDETEEIIRNINIELDDGSFVTIESGIVELFARLNNINDILLDHINHVENDIIQTMPSPSTSTPLASTEKGYVGSNKNTYALSDHAHPKGLATVADIAMSVEWSNIKNKPDQFTPTPYDHDHDDVYYKKSGGDITGEVGLRNNNGLYGYEKDNTTKAYIGYIDASDRVHIGRNKANPILLDGKLLLTTDNYGTADPSTLSGAVTGQIYLQLI